jgi:hypothetical protein
MQQNKQNFKLFSKLANCVESPVAATATVASATIV